MDRNTEAIASTSSPATPPALAVSGGAPPPDQPSPTNANGAPPPRTPRRSLWKRFLEFMGYAGPSDSERRERRRRVSLVIFLLSAGAQVRMQLPIPSQILSDHTHHFADRHRHRSNHNILCEQESTPRLPRPERIPSLLRLGHPQSHMAWKGCICRLSPLLGPMDEARTFVSLSAFCAGSSLNAFLSRRRRSDAQPATAPVPALNAQGEVDIEAGALQAEPVQPTLTDYICPMNVIAMHVL